MKKNSKISFAFLLLGTTLILGNSSPTVFASIIDMTDENQTIQGQESVQIEALGYLGTPYHMTAHNIVVHVKDIPKLNIWLASEACVSVMTPTEGEKDSVTPVINAPTLQSKAGVYPAELSIKEDPMVHTTIKIFVLDNYSSTDGRTVLLGHNFQLTKAEKMRLTTEKEEIVAGIHAYDVVSGQEITSEVQEKPGDLEKYLQEDLKPVAQKFSVRGVSLTLKASTLLTPGKGQDNGMSSINNLRDSLPDTGDMGNSLSALGMFVLTLLGLFVVNKQLEKKGKEENDETTT